MAKKVHREPVATESYDTFEPIETPAVPAHPPAKAEEPPENGGGPAGFRIFGVKVAREGIVGDAKAELLLSFLFDTEDGKQWAEVYRVRLNSEFYESVEQEKFDALMKTKHEALASASKGTRTDIVSEVNDRNEVRQPAEQPHRAAEDSSLEVAETRGTGR